MVLKRAPCQPAVRPRGLWCPRSPGLFRKLVAVAELPLSDATSCIQISGGFPTPRGSSPFTPYLAGPVWGA